MLAPSYSEALLMDPSNCLDENQRSSATPLNENISTDFNSYLANNNRTRSLTEIITNYSENPKNLSDNTNKRVKLIFQPRLSLNLEQYSTSISMCECTCHGNLIGNNKNNSFSNDNFIVQNTSNSRKTDVDRPSTSNEVFNTNKNKVFINRLYFLYLYFLNLIFFSLLYTCIKVN